MVYGKISKKVKTKLWKNCLSREINGRLNWERKYHQTLTDFGRDLKGVKGVKENMMMFIEAMAVLKEREN